MFVLTVRDFLETIKKFNPEEKIYIGIEAHMEVPKNNVYLETNYIQTIVETTDGILIRGCL